MVRHHFPESRGFLSFDVSSVSGQVIGAVLRLDIAKLEMATSGIDGIEVEVKAWMSMPGGLSMPGGDKAAWGEVAQQNNLTHQSINY